MQVFRDYRLIECETTMRRLTPIAIREVAVFDTEEVVPVVHAHWIDTWGHSLFECSACGNEFDDRLMLLDHQNDFPNYCPNCGAKMDEEVE